MCYIWKKCIEEAISNDDINKKKKNSNKRKLVGKFFNQKEMLRNKFQVHNFFLQILMLLYLLLLLIYYYITVL